MNFEKGKFMKKIEKHLTKSNLVEPTHSNWAALSYMLKRGMPQISIEYRGLNNQIEQTSWPLPRISDVIDSYCKMFFCNIDLTSGYFQIALDGDSPNLTAFLTLMALYK